ncbi:MAG TPA: hypothetical protein VD966_08755 [Pyrinomonadaceae bacterium]|nr:hypothetical protein [Pyrinomonadaceae bacterium]
MKSLTDILIGVVGLIAIVVAFWQFMMFVTAKDPRTGITDMTYGLNNLWIAIGAAIIACAAVVIYFVRHPRQEEEIHVTR